MGDLAAEAGERLAHARRANQLVPALTEDDVPDFAAAYAVQRAAIAAWPQEPIGWKIGATSADTQARLKLAEPFYGPMFAAHSHPSGTAIPGGIGGKWYRENIAICNPETIYVGEEYDTEPGNMHGNTVKGVEALIALDPGARWDTATNQVVGSDFDPWVGSPRIGIVPTFDPGRSFRPGRKPLVFTNFIAIFFESVSGKGNDQQVHGRILFATGIGGGQATAPGAKFVQLIE